MMEGSKAEQPLEIVILTRKPRITISAFRWTMNREYSLQYFLDEAYNNGYDSGYGNTDDTNPYDKVTAPQLHAKWVEGSIAGMEYAKWEQLDEFDWDDSYDYDR